MKPQGSVALDEKLLGVEKTDISKIAVSQEVESLQKELQMTKELLKAKDEIIELLKNKPTVYLKAIIRNFILNYK